MFSFAKNQEKIVMVVLGIALIAGVYFLTQYFGSEGYVDITAKIARENNPAKEKYEHQDISQESAKVAGQEYEELVDEERIQEAEANQAAKPLDLLPFDEESNQWALTNPRGDGSLQNVQTMEAAHFIGIDTQVSSMKNANLQLRSEPPIPKTQVSIWNNSTYTGDEHRRHMEIG